MLAVCLVVCPFTASSVRADAPPQRELLLFEEPVVTAAAKHPQLAREAPSAVTVISREDIERFGYRTLAEVLRSVRGFHGSYDRNYDYIGVRGFLRPGDYNDRILLLVNGHTYNDDVYQTAAVGNEFGIDLEAVEHIEVIRGPGSALYGGNALFAVINVVTATGQDRPGIRPLVETGSFGRKRGQVSAGHVFENGLDVFASGSVLDVDGHSELFYPEFDSPETNNGIARDADSERALNFYLRAQYRKLVLHGGANTRDKHVPTGFFETTFADPGTKTIDSRRFADLSYSDELLPDLTVTARAYYDAYYYHGTYIYGEGEERTKNEDFASSDWVGSEIQGRWEAPGRNLLTLGGEFTYHPGAAQRNFDLPGGERILDDNRSFTTWGIYAQDELSVRPDLTLVGGLRFDRYYNRLDHVSPRAAAIWHPVPETHVKLLFGQAFRPPNQFEQFYAYDSEGFISLANPGLDPERITTYEAVLEQRLWGRVEGTIALYHYDIRDLIDQVAIEGLDPDASGVQYRNVGSARANGAELGLRVSLPYGTTGRGHYSIQEARSTGGQLLSNSPKHLGNLGLAFPLPWDLTGAAELQVVGPRRTLAGSRVGTAAVANLNFRWVTPIPRLGFAAGLYNIFDQTYADPVAAEHAQESIEQDGFTFRLRLHYAF